jgi:hypothetical protein
VGGPAVIKFLINAAVVLVVLFIIVLLLSLMTWILTKLLRFLFPSKLNVPVSGKREEDDR